MVSSLIFFETIAKLDYYLHQCSCSSVLRHEDERVWSKMNTCVKLPVTDNPFSYTSRQYSQEEDL